MTVTNNFYRNGNTYKVDSATNTYSSINSSTGTRCTYIAGIDGNWYYSGCTYINTNGGPVGTFAIYVDGKDSLGGQHHPVVNVSGANFSGVTSTNGVAIWLRATNGAVINFHGSLPVGTYIATGGTINFISDKSFTSVGTAPTIAVFTNNLGGGGSGSVNAGSDDEVGGIILTTGAVIATAAKVATVSYATPKTAADRFVILYQNSANAYSGNATPKFFTTNFTTTGFDIYTGNGAPATLTAFPGTYLCHP